MSEVLRYLGIAKESVYGTKVAPKFFIDQASADINPPSGAELIKPSGLTRTKRDHGPGMYIPEGSVDFVGDPAVLWYILWILLGSKSTTDNTTPTVAEAIPADGSGNIDATLVNLPVVPGTIIIDDSVAAQKAHDDGFGLIVEDASSGIAGTINYKTGVIAATGGVPSEAYVADYSSGDYEHIITPDNDNVLPSATFSMGKDLLEQVFTGVAINQLVLTVSREWAMISLTVLTKKDEKETILTLATIQVPQGFPLPFHKVTMKAADFGSALIDISTTVEELTLTINNNGDAEGGVTIGDRHPRKVFGGDLEITADLVIHFDDTSQLEDFWGGATGPSSDGTQEKVYQIFLDGGTLGNCTIDLFKAIMNDPPALSPSGRERISQSFSVEALHDSVAAGIAKFTCNSVYNYN